MKKKNRFIYIYCIIILLAGIFIFIDYNANRIFGDATIIAKYPTEYSDLFNSKAKTDLIWGATYYTKGRCPISVAVYGLEQKDVYEIYIYKVNLLQDIPLIKLLKEENANYVKENNELYQNIVTEYEFKNRKDSISPVSNIYLNFRGDAMQKILENDSIAEFYIKFNNFSISYEENGIPDIVINDYNNNYPRGVPLDILLIKKEKKLYFLFIRSAKNKSNPSDLFLSLIQ